MTQDRTSTTAIQLHDVVKRFGNVTALDGVSFSIEDREFFTLLGPSGCGKTTLLRLIAGFEGATAGQIALHGQNISHLSPNQRPVNTVFQQYSLFPHMTVAENIKFGLQMKGSTAAHMQKRTQQMLELVQLGEFENRKPAQLSGGQQQRVALARALAPEPEVLLLDEPLSALDLKLRQAMRLELKHIQQDAGITFIFVTHDQEEALTMSDRIAVMSNGLVQQIGSAETIYEQPANAFVANFIGETNLLPARVRSAENGRVQCELGDGSIIECVTSDTINVGSAGQVCIRPERLMPSAAGNSAAGQTLNGTVEEHVYLGTDAQISIRLNSGELVQMRMPITAFNNNRQHAGEPVALSVDQNAARFFVDDAR